MGLINKRYQTVRKLGQGGTSEVFLATDLNSGQPVAVKKLLLDGLPLEEARNARIQVRREAQLLKQLDHPGLVKVLDVFEERQTPYLVSEFIDGLDLRQTLETGLFPTGPEQVVDWGLQLCQVLGYLHTQSPPILFRDLKPGNVMRDQEGRLKLIDFGIARHFFPDRQTTATLRGYGTPGFAPLEQYAGGTDPRSDIYALGATLYTLVSGRTPPDAAMLAAGSETLLPSGAPQPLERVILKMMAQRSADRYPDVAAAGQALRALVQPAVAPKESIKFCPHRDQTLRTGSGLRRAPFTVAYEGGDQLHAYRLARTLSQQGRPSMPLFKEDFPELVPGCWQVLVVNEPGVP